MHHLLIFAKTSILQLLIFENFYNFEHFFLKFQNSKSKSVSLAFYSELYFMYHGSFSEWTFQWCLRWPPWGTSLPESDLQQGQSQSCSVLPSRALGLAATLSTDIQWARFTVSPKAQTRRVLSHPLSCPESTEVLHYTCWAQHLWPLLT